MNLDINKWIEISNQRAIHLQMMQNKKIANGDKEYLPNDLLILYQYDYCQAMMNNNVYRAKKKLSMIIDLMIEQIYKKYCD